MINVEDIQAVREAIARAQVAVSEVAKVVEEKRKKVDDVNSHQRTRKVMALNGAITYCQSAAEGLRSADARVSRVLELFKYDEIERIVKE